MGNKKGPDFLERIKSNFQNMSRGQKALAEYITSNYDKAAFLTAAKLGDIVGLSESTVVRFAYALGYQGYPELQNAIQEMLKDKLTTVARLELSAEQMQQGSILQKVMQADMKNMRMTLEDISEDTFKKAVDAILKAERIYLIGLRSATSLAHFLGYYLNMILRNVNITSPSIGDIFEQLLAVKKEDLVIGISFPRYTRTTVEAFEFAKKQGAATIAITDSALSPMGQKADLTLTAKSNINSFVDSFVAAMSVLNALIIAVAMREKSRVSKTLATLEEVWEQHHVFVAKEENGHLMI
ncbi:MAG: hypothetical protein PWQ82_1132 [Thermosediminibacterales bacterium]|nr:hypothetical protein [Thermosediminibacterales bacterium]MDK2835674.1 hypothetical protein [Thermosediminibacterales bacterium]